MPNNYKSNHFKKIVSCLITFTLLNLILVSGGSDDDSTAADLLIKFKASLTNSAALNDWANPTLGPLCSGNTSRWTGLKCWKGKLRGLKLEGMGLGGFIDLETLAQVPRLHRLVLTNNSFEGPVPELRRLAGIRAVYLSGNRFSGEIPRDAFEGMKYLKKVGLGNNLFIGKLPESLAGLEKLVELKVDGNKFEGNIPDFPTRDWRLLSFARNRFSGRIPASFSNVNQSAFLGNKGLCGAPLGPCKSSYKPIIIVIIALSVLTLISAITLMACLKARHSRAQISETKLGPQTKVYKRFTFRDNKAQSSDRYDKEGKMVEKSNLHFTRSSAERFELEDLLRASADVLGSGSFGSSYKAALFSGPALVVKRFRCVSNVGREGFQAHMSRIGKLAHPNVLPIVAYYYTKEEKLLISNFVENGSLASHLHGKRAIGQKGLDWAARLKIIKGVSKGLMYLYREFADLSLPHGHLKSSNVLLDGEFNPLLADYALAPLVSARQFLAAHKSPESSQRDRVTKKTDVWSLGILILELLTGKFPANYLVPINDRGSGDLAGWVKAVVKEEWNGELFDKEMDGTKDAQGQMYKLLKIGMCCCDPVVDQRWDCLLATDRIDELRERDNVVGDETDYVSDWDVYHSSSALSSYADFSYSIKKV